jgi:accessory colonization factor AcfC
MRLVLFAALSLSLALAARSMAQDKEIVLKGKITCAKCELKKEPKCATVIIVKHGDKELIYYFDSMAHKSIHMVICSGGGKNGSVTGTVTEQAGRKTVTVKKVSFDKDP